MPRAERAKKRKPRAKARRRAWARLRALRPSRAWLDAWVVAAGLLVVLDLLEAQVWLGALAAELHVQLALLAALAAAAAFVGKRFVRGSCLVSCAVFWCVPLLPYLRPSRPTPPHGPVLRVVQQHAAQISFAPATLAQLLASGQADLFSLTGLSADQARLLRHDFAGYSLAAGGGLDRLLWARADLQPRPAPNGQLSLQLGGCSLEVVQVQLPSLFVASELAQRRRLLEGLIEAPRPRRRIYVGQLGSRAAAADLSAWREAQGLRDARLGHGRLANAPALLGALGLPLDHVLVHGWILVRDVHTDSAFMPAMPNALHASLELTEPQCARPRR